MAEPELQVAPTALEELLAEVNVFVGSELVAKYCIEQGEYIIGRDASCPIMVDADEVSRHHARLTFNAFELVIEDLGSSNGVFIDGVALQLPTRVRLDQEVQIGAARLVIRLREAAARQYAAALWDKDLGLTTVREQLEGKKYKVITTINRGGMGVILQARDLRIRRTVAMKVMKTSSQFSRENVLRFIDEAQLTGQLEHPNIVPVYELGIDELGETFYTMKFVKGTTLDDVLRGIRAGKARVIDRFPLGVLLTIFQKVCDGMAFAHSKGVVHRDLKPENIMIGSFGEVLVMDWGLGKNMTGGRREGRPEIRVDSAALRAQINDLRGFETMNGLIVGTPPYISPEQARGELDKIDARSDIYVLGGILYSILTLRPPVEGESVQDVVERIVQSRITPPSIYNQVPKPRPRSPYEEERTSEILLDHCPNRRIPDGLAAIALKALQLDPVDRYQCVEDLQADVAAFQGGFAPKAERAGAVKQVVLFAGRHRREVAIFVGFALIFQVFLVLFFFQLKGERDRAQANEKRALQSQELAAQRLNELQGTAPTFAAEAQQLVDDLKMTEALEKIEYAIQQVPNEPQYHVLHGNILEAQLRFDEAESAYEEALRIDPNDKAAKANLALTKKLISEIGKEAQPSPAILTELYAALIEQNRRGEAQYVQTQFGLDKQRLFAFWRDMLERRGLRKQRFQTNSDDTLTVDFSRMAQPDLHKLHGTPVTGLILDDARITEINDVRGLPLESLSLGHTAVRDLAPLMGMPLRSLNLEGTSVLDLSPVRKLPLENLRLSFTRIANLDALQGMKIEQLNLTGCRAIKDLSPLRGMPLQTLMLNHTLVQDLQPLIESPLRELNLENCAGISDLHPLLAISSLEGVLIPKQCRDIGFLRKHPGLKRISYKKMTQTAEDFWKEFDAENAKTAPPGAAASPPSTSAPAVAPAAVNPAALVKPAANLTAPPVVK